MYVTVSHPSLGCKLRVGGEGALPYLLWCFQFGTKCRQIIMGTLMDVCRMNDYVLLHFVTSTL